MSHVRLLLLLVSILAIGCRAQTHRPMFSSAVSAAISIADGPASPVNQSNGQAQQIGSGDNATFALQNTSGVVAPNRWVILFTSPDSPTIQGRSFKWDGTAGNATFSLLMPPGPFTGRYISTIYDAQQNPLSQVTGTISNISSSQPVNPFWSQTAWYFSNTGSDTNDCQTAGTPCKTYAQVQYTRWGCFGDSRGCPRLQGGMHLTLNFAPGWASGSTDPVHFNPALEGGSNAVMTCTGIGNTSTSGTIGTYTARNLTPGSASLPTIVMPTAGSEGYVSASAGYPTSAPFPQLVVDATNSAKWWVYKQSSGTTYFVSTPVVPQTAPLAVGTQYALATPVSGDSVTVYDPCAIDVVQVEPVMVDWDAAQTAGVTLQNMRIASESAPTVLNNASNEVRIGSYVSMYDVASDRSIVKAVTGPTVDVMDNVFGFNLFGSTTAGNGQYMGQLKVFGGVFFEGNGWGSNGQALLILDGDVIMRDTRVSSTEILSAYADQSASWQIVGTVTMTTSAVFTSALSALWTAPATPFSLDVAPGGRVSITSQTAVHHLINSTLSICSKTVACNGDNINVGTGCNISLTPTNIDAVFSDAGFAGNATVPGCGSIGKFGTINP